MRRERFFGMAQSEALALLAAAPVVQLASTTTAGAPLLRSLHTVVLDGALCFHAAPVGDKTEALGRPVVVSAAEVVASIPSDLLVRSVQLHGTLESVESPHEQARVLQALMEKYHPGTDYDEPVGALFIGRVARAHLDGKAKLAQNRSPEERARLCETLWARGGDGDPRAIEIIRAANPDMATPAFLRTNLPLTLHCALETADIAAAVEMLAGEYWNAGQHSEERIAGALRAATAWVGARDGEGRLIACARALSDGHKYAWIYDVIVAPPWRRAGLAQAVMRLLLDHPRVRGAASVLLQTRDAQPLYRKLGFIDEADAPCKPYRSTRMLRIQR
jgi:ribosomal protein S18 acetylase RimI-like enzyme/nitroimidazol reductase NimA-like FMN-containing flavoprotein (pyridoxamine 5'-phosphate oxidase superfamily)